jgi:hypothetical protein
MSSKSTLKNFIKLLYSLVLSSILILLIIKNPLPFLIGFLIILLAGVYLKLRTGKELSILVEGIVEGIENFFRNMAWLYVSLLIAKVAGSLFRALETTSLTWLQISLLAVMGVLLSGGLWLLSSEKQREKFFGSIRKYFGGWAPFIYSFTLLYIAVDFFSSVTYLLVKNDLLPWTPANQEITSSQIGNFYLWHFVDAIPLLKVTSTLRWAEPLKYDNGAIGFLLLLFKIVVISPVIASFIWYRQYVAKEKKKEESQGTAKKIVYRIYRPKRRTFPL